MLQEVNKMLDLGELIKRAVKYLVEGFMVAVAAYAIPKRSLRALAPDSVSAATLSDSLGNCTTTILNYDKNNLLFYHIVEMNSHFNSLQIFFQISSCSIRFTGSLSIGK